MEYSFGSVIPAPFMSSSSLTEGSIDSRFRGNDKTKSGMTNNTRLTFGLHPKNNYYEIFDLEECFLQSPLSVKIVRGVADWARQNNISTLRNLIVREGKNTGEVLVNLVTTSEDLSLDSAFAKWISNAFPGITSLYRTAVLVERNKRTIWKERLLTGKETLAETLSVGSMTLRFEILPQAFFQPNTKQAETLYGKILEFAQPRPQDSVLDLFCGTGTVGIFFAKLGCSVLGVDSNESAIESARENAAKNSLNNIEFICGDVGVISTEPSPSRRAGRVERSRLDAVPSPSMDPSTRPAEVGLALDDKHTILIADPPRAGITPKTLEKIISRKIPKWIYVSCNPTTLARDLKTICGTGGYRIIRIQPVDMFPHTYHVETICLLTN